MKRVLNFIAAIVTVILMISCNQENNINTNEEINATMIYPDGLPSIAISKLITDNRWVLFHQNEKLQYWVALVLIF